MVNSEDCFSGENGFLARDLMMAVPGIPLSMPCGEAMAVLLAQPQLPCLAVVGDAGEPLGVVERERLLSTFSNSLQSELYRRRPIRKFLHDSYLAVDEATHVDEISALIARHHPAALSAGFIVTAGGRYAGVCSGIRLLSMVETLTRRRAADLEIARTRAEAASRAKSTFLAAMSHEIRTPLNSVVGNLELLEDAESRQERSDLIGAALSAAQTLLHILGDVLDFSRIESDRIQLEHTPTSPAEIVRDVAGQLFSKARERGVALTVHISCGVPERVLGDPLRLRQIMLNMAGNALKFTTEGRVALSLTWVRGGDETSDAPGITRLRFEVADTGAGFAPERAHRLFEAFTQEEASTTRRFGGAGLGLAICHRLVGAMGGTIGADGKPGGGATFWFEIPVPVVALAESDCCPAALGGARVLVLGEGGAASALSAAGAAVDREEQADGPAYAAVVFEAGAADEAATIAAMARRFSVSRLILTYPVGTLGLARVAYRHGFVQALARPCPPADICRAVAIVLGVATSERVEDDHYKDETKPAALSRAGAMVCRCW
ncbi:MAG: ATP-binding protein [Rhodospirillaceae bacterium]